MVLDHVPHGADLIIKSAAGADAFLFRHGDLDVVDQVAVPDRLPNGIGEAEVEEVLDGFLAEVVVDTEEIRLIQAGLQIVDQLAGGLVVVAKGFFDDDPGRRPGRTRPALANCCTTVAK